jgi:DNA-binding MarR family transcriptional regulator
MSASPTFGTQLIGQAENALNAILDRELAGTGLTEPQWVTLTIAVMSGGTIDRTALGNRVADALKVSDSHAQQRIAELTDAHLLEPGDGSRVNVTDAGGQLHAQVRATVTEITHRLWGDMPAGDLETATRVLGAVLERANAELANG